MGRFDRIFLNANLIIKFSIPSLYIASRNVRAERERGGKLRANFLLISMLLLRVEKSKAEKHWHFVFSSPPMKCESNLYIFFYSSNLKYHLKAFFSPRFFFCHLAQATPTARCDLPMIFHFFFHLTLTLWLESVTLVYQLKNRESIAEGKITMYSLLGCVWCMLFPATRDFFDV